MLKYVLLVLMMATSIAVMRQWGVVTQRKDAHNSSPLNWLFAFGGIGAFSAAVGWCCSLLASGEARLGVGFAVSVPWATVLLVVWLYKAYLPFAERLSEMRRAPGAIEIWKADAERQRQEDEDRREWHGPL